MKPLPGCVRNVHNQRQGGRASCQRSCRISAALVFVLCLCSTCSVHLVPTAWTAFPSPLPRQLFPFRPQLHLHCSKIPLTSNPGNFPQQCLSWPLRPLPWDICHTTACVCCVDFYTIISGWTSGTSVKASMDTCLSCQPTWVQLQDPLLTPASC